MQNLSDNTINPCGPGGQTMLAAGNRNAPADFARAPLADQAVAHIPVSHPGLHARPEVQAALNGGGSWAEDESTRGPWKAVP
jgi:hypothetical protein